LFLGDGELAFLCSGLQEALGALQRLEELDGLAAGLVKEEEEEEAAAAAAAAAAEVFMRSTRRGAILVCGMGSGCGSEAWRVRPSIMASLVFSGARCVKWCVCVCVCAV